MKNIMYVQIMGHEYPVEANTGDELYVNRLAQYVEEKMREMKQGFWWEFVARVHRGGFSILEIPVRHQLRAAGVTQVYQAKKMPGIFIKHVIAIFKIRAQTRTKL